MAGAAVADDVGRALAHRPCQHRLDRGIERHRGALDPRLDPGGRKRHLRAGDLVVQRRLAVAADRLSHLGESSARDLLDLGHVPCRLGRLLTQQSPRELRLQSDHRQAVAQQVVQVAREPRAFVGDREPRELGASRRAAPGCACAGPRPRASASRCPASKSRTRRSPQPTRQPPTASRRTGPCTAARHRNENGDRTHIAIATTVKMKSVPQPCRSSAVSADGDHQQGAHRAQRLPVGQWLLPHHGDRHEHGHERDRRDDRHGLGRPIVLAETASTSGIAMNTSQMNIRIRPTAVRGGSPRRASVSRLTIVSAERSRAGERSRSLSVPAV